VGIEGEAADKQHVEADALDGLLGRVLDEVRADRAVLGSDRHRDALRLSVLAGVLPLGVDEPAGVGIEAVKLKPLLLERVLDRGLAQVVDDHVVELAGAGGVILCGTLGLGKLLVGAEDAVRREALDGERAGHADALVVLVGLVVEYLGLRVPGDGLVDLLLALAGASPTTSPAVRLLPPASLPRARGAVSTPRSSPRGGR
jgi:hypothetical protein